MNVGVIRITKAFTGAASEAIFIAANPGPNYQLVEAPTVRFGTAGGSGATVDLVISPSGTSVASGVSALSAPVALTGSADTNVKGTLSTTLSKTVLPPGSCLGLKFAGTIGSFATGVITFGLRRITGLL